MHYHRTQTKVLTFPNLQKNLAWRGSSTDVIYGVCLLQRTDVGTRPRGIWGSGGRRGVEAASGRPG